MGAAILDIVVQTIAFVGIGYILSFFSMSTDDYFEYFIETSQVTDDYLQGLIFLGIYMGFFIILNGFLLISQGQTIGKRLVGIHIVNQAGDIPDVFHIIGLRFIAITVIGLIPYFGEYFGLIDVLFIFGAKRMCLHDYLAKTRVIDREATEFETDYTKKQQIKAKSTIKDSEINSTGIEYSNYTKKELEETLSNINQREYPERAEKLKLALKRFEEHE